MDDTAALLPDMRRQVAPRLTTQLLDCAASFWAVAKAKMWPLITELAELQASERTIMSVAGHVSRQMMEHYSHIRLDAKRLAVEALSQRGKTGDDVTNHVTNAVSAESPE